MELVLFLGLGYLLYRVFRPSEPSMHYVDTEEQLRRRNQEWAEFIAGYRKIAKLKAEKQLLDRMLGDIHAQGLAWIEPNTDTDTGFHLQEVEASAAISGEATGFYQEIPVPAAPGSVKAEPHAPATIDNASLLLYFGAFLFTASIGLFVAFSETSGALKTLAILMVTGVLYGGGIWIYRTKPKLQQAGIAFTGIGMAIAPLLGVAMHYYLFAETNGAVTWMFTSFLCMALYVHALATLRHPLISYLLIFTFLSLFESAVSIIEAPIYYFGWGMALVGIILGVASRVKGYWPELEESSRQSSQVFLPLALFVSVVLIGEHGTTQFAISLLFAAAFYGLQAMATTDSEQQTDAIAAQAAGLGGIVFLTYGIADSWVPAAITLIVINVVQLAVIVFNHSGSRLMENFGSVVLASTVAAIVMGATSGSVLMFAFIAAFVSGIVVWLSQKRLDSFVLASIAWMSLPIVFGQFVIANSISAELQAVSLLGSYIVFTGFYLVYKKRSADAQWPVLALQMLVISAAAVVIAALFATPIACLVVTAGIVLTFILLAEVDSQQDIAVLAGLIAGVPIVRSLDSPKLLVISSAAALLINIFLALRHRSEITRWFGSLIWLFMPVAISGSIAAWGSEQYTWAYLVTVVGFVTARAIGRGIIFLSAKVPVKTYERQASYAYVYGYILAAVIAFLYSLITINPRLHTTLLLTAVACIVIVLSRVIEKRHELEFLVPMLLQAVLLSVLRPVAKDSEIYLLLSTVLAAGSYLLLPAHSPKEETGAQDGALATLFIAPLSLFIIGTTLWPMPFGLAVAGIVMLHKARSSTQANREWAAGTLVLSLMWFMYYLGIRELQAYTHVLAATFGAYAYWRYVRNERSQSDEYLWAMLATATIPLALQAIGAKAGGIYGWWLLLEQVGFMLLGMAIGRRSVTFWGLYVAVAAVLYQLRHLGWAALTVLAVFLIGIAIYYLQRSDSK